jgi:acyl transferase domain-containing protein/NAD(P)-dependent dehydrogenase (short-subunit alcohol dehydrogenase family)
VPGPEAGQLDGGRFQADLSSPDSVRALHALLASAGGGPVGGLFNCLGLGEPFCRPGCDDDGLPLQVGLWTLNVVKELIGDLEASAARGGGWYVNVTPMGGRFGLDGGAAGERLAFAAAGTVGFTKALSREYPALGVRNVDVDATLDPAELATRLLGEIPAADEMLEVGLDREGRWRIDARKEAVPAARGPLPVGPDSVVLVTGGGQGVTADVVKALAAAARPYLVIAGLSPLPAPEAPETVGLDRAALRRFLLERARAGGGRVVPADVERGVNRILKDRQIRVTLEACAAAGARVEYHCLDVRDAKSFEALIDNVYARLGRIDGVIHGAGVIDDRLLADKTPESFTRVFVTKANSALTLARKLRPEGLKVLAFFSSVAARLGNRGQADYSAANEFLNKLADDLARRWPGRVVALGWGPWDGGMVTEVTRDLRWAYDGTACVWPGARDLRQYWANLVNGVDAIGEPPPGRWSHHANFDPQRRHDALPGRRCGFLPDGLVYDPLPHRVLPNLVRHGDADQFLMLDVIDRALKDARVGPDDSVRRCTDVIIGRGNYPTGKLNEMALRVELIDGFLAALAWKMPDVMDPQRLRELDAFLRSRLTPADVDSVSTGVPNLAASRAANRLNLRGSAYTVDGACASSLLAVEQAVWRLRNGQSDLAVAAGLFLCLTPTFLSVFASLGALSRSQVIRPFDRRADGLLAGEGGGAVILKRLEDARRDGDAVYAVIKGVGSASDGKEVDVMAPAVVGQVKALEAAFADAGVDRDTIGYLELHGTGTAAGDLAEIATIKQFFGTSRCPATARAMGSVKSMIGHTMPAAGMASLIKMALALSNKVLAPSLHCEEPRPELADAPFYVLTHTRPWVHNPARGPRRGGINSFGFGGINAHVVLEEVPDPSPSRRSQILLDGPALRPRPFSAARERPTELVCFAALSRQDLAGQLRRLENFLAEDRTGAALADVGAALGRGVELDRPVKLALVCRDLPHLLDLLGKCREQLAAPEGIRTADEVYFSEAAAAPNGKIACVIPGMGLSGMGGNFPDRLLELCLHFPEVRAEFDLFEDRDGHPEDPVPTSIALAPPPHLPAEVRGRLAARLVPPTTEEVRERGNVPADRCLAPVGVSLGNWAGWVLLRKLGVPVDLITGQSMGEAAAVCAAGLGDFHAVLPNYWKAIALDARPADDAILAFVCADAEQIEPLLARYPGTHVAVYPEPRSVIIAGRREDLQAILAELHREKVLATLLPYGAVHTPHHSHLRGSLGELFPEKLVEGRKRNMEVYSSITADKFPEEPAALAATMMRNLDQPLRIWQTVRKMYEDGARVFVQLGAADLGSNLELLLPPGARAVTASLDSAKRHPLTQLDHLCATLFTAGVPFRLAPLWEGRPVREIDPAVPQPAPSGPALGIPLRISWNPLDGEPRPEAPAAAPAAAGPAPDPNLPVLGEVVEFVAGRQLVIERRLDLDEDLYLHDHLFVVSAPKSSAERLPTVPLTFSMEFAAEAASLLTPGLTLVGFENVRGRRWVQPRPGADVLRIAATLRDADAAAEVRHCDVELWLGGQLCFSTTVLFAPTYRHDLALEIGAGVEGEPWPFALEEVYGERILFHGPGLQGITGLGRLGPVSTLTLSVLPRQPHFASRPVPRLLADPALMDAMGAGFGLWAYTAGHTMMPIGVEKVEICGPPPPVGSSLQLRIEATEFSPETRQARCNMQLVDANGFVWMRARGWADWLLNWPYEFSLYSRMPEQHLLARELPLPGLPEGAVCTLLTPRDVGGVGLEWLTCMFLHANEAAALGPVDEGKRGLLYACGGAKDAVRCWWARRHGGPLPHPSAFCIGHDAAGRPFLEPAGDPHLPYLSCTHTEGAFVTLVSDVPVGVDLEPAARDTQALLPHFATAEEVDLLGHLAAAGPDEAWATRLWCAKEAVSKVVGTGLEGRPKNFVALDGDADGRLLVEHRPTGRHFVVHTTRVREYILAYTTDEGGEFAATAGGTEVDGVPAG